jgi:hypothetical protein
MDEFEIIVDPARPPDSELAAVIIPGIVRRLSSDAHQRCLRTALNAVGQERALRGAKHRCPDRTPP